MAIASGVSLRPIIACTRPLSIMDAIAVQQTMRAPTFTKLAKIAGSAITAGGMKTSVAGIPNTTGTTTAMIASGRLTNEYRQVRFTGRSGLSAAPLLSPPLSLPQTFFPPVFFYAPDPNPPNQNPGGAPGGSMPLQ